MSDREHVGRKFVAEVTGSEFGVRMGLPVLEVEFTLLERCTNEKTPAVGTQPLPFPEPGKRATVYLAGDDDDKRQMAATALRRLGYTGDPDDLLALAGAEFAGRRVIVTCRKATKEGRDPAWYVAFDKLVPATREAQKALAATLMAARSRSPAPHHGTSSSGRNPEDDVPF